MADPVVAACLYAETRGLIQFATCDHSTRWWSGARMRLHQARRDMDAEIARAALVRAAADTVAQVQGGRQSLYDAERQLQAAVRGRSDSSTSNQDDLDLVAQMYIEYAWEYLKRMGVDFGALEPVPKRRRHR